MLIEQHIVSVRRQFTGESLEAARRRLRELQDWSAPIPAAAALSDQERLESYLLQALGTSQGRHPLGISEIVPTGDRLVLRLDSADVFTALLPLLPYRDGRRSRHGVIDLRATATRGGVELMLGRSGEGRAHLLGPRKGSDLALILAAYQVTLQERRHLPLWSEDTPHDPLPRPLRISRSRSSAKPARHRSRDPHTASPRLASALLRRVHLWQWLTGASDVTITSAPSEGGPLAWTVERRVSAGTAVHDGDIATVLADPVAGPGLTADTSGHLCDNEQCLQSFASGRLIVRTVRDEEAHVLRRGARHVGLAVLRERPVEASVPGTSRAGHVLQLISPTGDERDPMDAAHQLAAAWAQQGLLTMVLRVEAYSREPVQTGWRRHRLSGGAGAMFLGKVSPANRELEDALTQSRTVFDHTILVNHQWTDMPSMGITPLADDHLIVAHGPFTQTTTRTTVRAGELQRHTIELTPAESAVAWMHKRMSRIPFAELPLTGLLTTTEGNAPDAFETMVETELARLGLPVIGRLNTSAFSTKRLRTTWRTVLDHIPDDQRTIVMQQSAQIRQGLGPAQANQAPLAAAIRQMMEL
ncbi:hypothetical protein ACFVUW_10910 [Streptomyces xiamenensis]|uniref:hypothetical protein n=1 Tax=Streptomyces xiamenensis TaxID=408015 RepID=UPI0036E5C31D